MKQQNFRLRGAVAASLGVGSLAAALLAPALAVAQTTQDAAATRVAAAGTPARANALEDVVVTARKVEENLQQVPVAVTAITAEAIEAQNIQNLEDVARFTPGFSFENFTGALAAPIIRGQTQTRVDLPVQNVASFFNGVYLQRGYMVDASLLDVERIEIIKGPQSALYGRNAFSGAINYVTKQPGDSLESSASLTVGNVEHRELKASVSGPLTDWLGVVLAIGHEESDGTWGNNHPLASQGNNTRGNLGGYDNQSALAGFALRPFDGFTVDAAFSWTQLDVEHQPSYSLGTTGLLNSQVVLNCSPLPPLAGGAPAPRLYCGELPTLPVLTAAEQSGPLSRPPGLVVDPRAFAQRGISRLGSLKAEWDVSESFTLAYLLGYTDTSVNGRGAPARNATRAPVPAGPTAGLTGFDSQPNGGFWSISHEARIEWRPGGLISRAMLGGFSSHSRDDASSWSMWGVPNSLAEPVAIFTFNNQTRRDEVIAAFGLVSFDLTDKLSLTAEARWTEETLTLQARQTSPGFIAVPLDSSAPILRSQEDDFDYVTPRVAIDYQLTDQNMIYASVGKGVKSGGQNVPGLDPAQDTYEPEENWTVEFGTKNDLLDDRLRLNAAVFYIDWTGIQGSVARNYPSSGRVLGVNCFVACAVPAPGTPVPVIVGNLGDAKVYGVELEGAWLATENLTFNYGLSYQRARYDGGQISQRAANSRNCDGIVCATSVFNSIGQAIGGAEIGGNTIERQPPFKGAVGVEWRFAGPIGGGEWTARTDVTYQDKQYADELNLAWVPSRTLVDASLQAKWGQFTARLWAKNLFDEEYVTSSLFLIGTDGARSASYVPLLGEKRTYGLTVGWRY